MARMIKYKGQLYKRVDSDVREKAANTAVTHAFNKAEIAAKKEGIVLKIDKIFKESSLTKVFDIKVAIEYVNYKEHLDAYYKGERKSALNYDNGKGFGDIVHQFAKDVKVSLLSQGFKPQALSVLITNSRIFYLDCYIK